MSQGNVPISLLLDGSKNQKPQRLDSLKNLKLPYASPASSIPGSIQNLISQYQTSVGLPQATSPIYVSDEPSPSLQAAHSSGQTSGSVPPAGQAATSLQAAPVLDHIKNFQTSFQLGAQAQSILPAQSAPPVLKAAPKNASSRASINSLINADDRSSIPSPPPNETAKQPEKKKRAAPKSDAANKRAKVDTKKAVKTEGKAEPKKSKSKKKTPEVVAPAQEKPAIHPTMATDLAKDSSSINLPEVSFVDDTKDADEKEKREPPVIALDIPLLDPKNPKPGQAQVVINVLKLAEDKYGWNVIHPTARSAIDLMDEMLEDEDDGDDDDEDDVADEKANTKSTDDKATKNADDKANVKDEKASSKGADEKANSKGADEKANPVKKKEELTEEQKVKRHEAKMNRKVGKYDFEDPFIDDAELQWEEEITTTKEGFFVYWGPLVDDQPSTKKGGSKSKK